MGDDEIHKLHEAVYSWPVLRFQNAEQAEHLSHIALGCLPDNTWAHEGANLYVKKAEYAFILGHYAKDDTVKLMQMYNG